MRSFKTSDNCQMKIVVSLILSFTTVATADDFKLVSGKEYKNVTVSRVEADGIVIKTKTGLSKIYFAELPKDVQEGSEDCHNLDSIATTPQLPSCANECAVH